jgi:hypothetical protein
VTLEERDRLRTEQELHLGKRKQFLKTQAQAGELLRISIHYMQNLPLSYIESNAVFYSRQL